MNQQISSAEASTEEPTTPTIIAEEEIQPIDVLFYGSQKLKVAHRKHAGTTAFRADLHRFVDEFQQYPPYLIAKELVRHVQKEYGNGSRFLKRVEFADANQFGLVGWRSKWIVLDTISAVTKVEKMVMRIQPQTLETTNLNAEEATDYTKIASPDATSMNTKDEYLMSPKDGTKNGAGAGTVDANACNCSASNGSASNDNSSGVLYVSFVGGHQTNPILRVQLPSDGAYEDNINFDLPYSGPNEALEATELSEAFLKQADIVDIKPLPPRSNSANTNAHASAVDNFRVQRHRARKDMTKSIYRLLKNQPDTWPQQWREWFAELPRPSLTSFVAKVEHMLYKRSKSFVAHVDMDTFSKRLYLVLTELDSKRRKLVSTDRGSHDSDTHEEAIDKAPNDADAEGRLIPSNSLPEASSKHDFGVATANKITNNNQANLMRVDCSLDDKNALGSDSISPKSVMDDISQCQQQLVNQPHPQQAFFPQTHNIPTTLNNFPHSPKTAHALRRIAEKGSKVAAYEEERWWNSNFNTLRALQKQHGVRIMSQPNKFANSHLRSWINEQHSQHNRKLKGMPNTMSDDREVKLYSAGFNLPWSSRELASKALAEESVERANEYCRVSVECTPRNFVYMCKRLANFEVACMEGGWSPMDPELEAWIAYMKAKQETKREGKPCEISDAMEYSLYRLGITCSLSKKVQVKIANGSIHQERITLFTNHRSFTAAERWRFMFDELAAFKNSQGSFLVSQSNNVKLYGWMNNQRKKQKESKLSEEQLDLLNNVGFDWQGPGKGRHTLTKEAKKRQVNKLRNKPRQGASWELFTISAALNGKWRVAAFQ